MPKFNFYWFSCFCFLSAVSVVFDSPDAHLKYCFPFYCCYKQLLTHSPSLQIIHKDNFFMFNSPLFFNVLKHVEFRFNDQYFKIPKQHLLKCPIPQPLMPAPAMPLMIYFCKKINKIIIGKIIIVDAAISSS